MKRLAIIAALSMLSITCSVSLFSTPIAAETDIYLKVGSFTWEEFSGNGTQLLKETGPLYSLGISYKNDPPKALTFKASFEGFVGVMEYNGQTQSGTPVNTDTDYLGLKLDLSLGYKFIVTEKASLEPFAGLGLSIWTRDIQSTTDASGYQEFWTISYAKLGVRGELVVSDATKLFAEGGIRLPLRNEVEFELPEFGLGPISVEPEFQPSAFGELGFKWKRLKAYVFYEGMRFARSDEVMWRGLISWKPESKVDIFGASVGVSF